MIRVLACLMLLSGASLAQDQEIVIKVEDGLIAEGGAVLRGLDRINGQTTDLEIAPGQSVDYARLKISLDVCKYPEGKEQVEAFAYLTVHDVRDADVAVFDGWMFASSPALSALDHPRYDVWVLRCKI